MTKTNDSLYNSGADGKEPKTAEGNGLYNLSELRKMANNDDEFLKQTLDIFLQNTESAVRDLLESLRERNWKRIGEIAHKILPSCRHLEVNAVVPRLLELKSRTLYNDDNEGVVRLVNETVTELNKTSESLKKELGHFKPGV